MKKASKKKVGDESGVGSKVMRVDDLTYTLVKAYAEEKGIPTACAIGEIFACPIKRKAIQEGREIPVHVDKSPK